MASSAPTTSNAKAVNDGQNYNFALTVLTSLFLCGVYYLSERYFDSSSESSFHIKLYTSDVDSIQFFYCLCNCFSAGWNSCRKNWV